jgi:hypothetical protein
MYICTSGISVLLKARFDKKSYKRHLPRSKPSSKESPQAERVFVLLLLDDALDLRVLECIAEQQ